MSAQQVFILYLRRYKLKLKNSKRSVNKRIFYNFKGAQTRSFCFTAFGFTTAKR
jgi:hypothetical protein